MKRRLNTRNNYGRIWTARTTNFVIALDVERSKEKYDGDDADGSIQAAIDSGEMVYFDSRVVVEFDGDEIGADYLGSSCYFSGRVSEFLKDGYFRDMLSAACEAARERVAAMPKLRAI